MRGLAIASGLVAVAVLWVERRRVRNLWREATVPEDMRKLDHIDTLARTLWGEARGEGSEGMHAVANVVVNRVAFARIRGGYWWGDDISEVCLKPWQFSCWNVGDPNRERLEAVTVSDPQYAEAVRLATMAVNGQLYDKTGGATHYHADWMVPGWIEADGATRTATIGRHRFYRGIA